jgi:Putative auto-transporter adhesin, head GIN domain
MKKLVILATILIASFATQAQKFVITDANAEVRKLSGFNAISVSHAVDLYLTQGDEEGVAVSASDAEYRSRIKTTVEGGVLKIWYDGAGVNWPGNNKRLKAYISFTNLQSLTASGASDITMNGVLKSESLKMTLSGASDFKGELNVQTLSLNISGASDAKINGTSNTLSVQASGASDLKGYDLVSETCHAQASGASSIKITVNKELNVVASGASDVYYKGAGSIRDIRTSGASSVSKKG